MSRDYTQSKDAHYTKILQIVGKQSKQKNNNKKNKGGCSMLSSKEIIIFVGLWGPHVALCHDFKVEYLGVNFLIADF